MKKFVKELKISVRQASFTQLRRTHSQSHLSITTPGLFVPSSSTNCIRHINYRPPRGQLRSSSLLRTGLQSRTPVVKAGLEVFGTTAPKAKLGKAPMSVSNEVKPKKREVANDTSFGADAKCWDIPEKTPEGDLSFSLEEDSPENESEQRGNWYSVGINPVVVVKISQGKNVQKSNTGLALDVDSSPISLRSPQSSQHAKPGHPPLPKPSLPKSKPKLSSSPYSTVLKGKKLIETSTPGVRFFLEPEKAITPNHFLADKSKTDKKKGKTASISFVSDWTEEKRKAIAKVQPSNSNSSVSLNTFPIEAEKATKAPTHMEVVNFSSPRGNAQFICQVHKGRPRIISLAQGKLYLIHNNADFSPKVKSAVPRANFSRIQIHRGAKTGLILLKG